MRLLIDGMDRELFQVLTKIALGSGDMASFGKLHGRGSTPLKEVALACIVLRPERIGW